MATEPASDLHLVDVAGAVDYRPCKRPACTAPARALRGPYALLCDDHADQLRPTIQANGRRGGQASVARHGMPRPGGQAGDGEYLQLARRVLEAGRALDRAKARYRPARDAFQVAMAEWRDALQAAAQGVRGGD